MLIELMMLTNNGLADVFSLCLVVMPKQRFSQPSQAHHGWFFRDGQLVMVMVNDDDGQSVMVMMFCCDDF